MILQNSSLPFLKAILSQFNQKNKGTSSNEIDEDDIVFDDIAYANDDEEVDVSDGEGGFGESDDEIDEAVQRSDEAMI
jgi:hypothetical protein